MKNSNSMVEFEKMNSLLRKRNRAELRIADYCSYALLKNRNYSMTYAELSEEILALGYVTDGKTLDRTISTITRVQNRGLFDKPRNAKIRLKRSIYNKLVKKSARRKMNETFRK